MDERLRSFKSRSVRSVPSNKTKLWSTVSMPSSARSCSTKSKLPTEKPTAARQIHRVVGTTNSQQLEMDGAEAPGIPTKSALLGGIWLVTSRTGVVAFITNEAVTGGLRKQKLIQDLAVAQQRLKSFREATSGRTRSFQVRSWVYSPHPIRVKSEGE